MNWLMTIGVRILEVLFFAGWIGSLLVVVLGLKDFILAGKDQDESGSEPATTQEANHPS
jgi:hypothetical protein